MNRFPVTLLLLPLLIPLSPACAPAPAPHGHEHGPDAAHGHEHPPAAATTPDAAATPADPASPPQALAGATEGAPSGPAPFALGAHTARLEVRPEGLRLALTDASGAPLAASGDARVSLTGVGEAEQRLLLSPAGDAWAGAVQNTGAKGYVAVISLELAGHTEVARVSWGEPLPTPKAHTHDGAAAGDHGHAH